MKKKLMIATLMLATLGANAQEMYAKAMAGGVLSNLVGDVSNNKMKFGAVGGLEIGCNITDMFAITGGVLYSMQGCKNDLTDSNLNLNYINVPVLANVYVIPGLAIKAGPQIGFLMSAKIGDISQMDYHKKIDFSVPVGLSYEFSDVVIDARYNIGLTDIYKNSGGDKIRNGVIMLTIGYKIPM